MLNSDVLDYRTTLQLIATFNLNESCTNFNLFKMWSSNLCIVYLSVHTFFYIDKNLPFVAESVFIQYNL